MTNTESPRTRLMAGAMVVAPVLLVASTLASAAGGGFGQDQIGGTIQIYAFVAFTLALLGLTQLLESAHPRVATALTVTALLGTAGGVAYGVDVIYRAVHSGASLDETALGPLALNLPGLMFPLSLIAIGIGLARARLVPIWSALALALGGLLFPMSRIPSIAALAVAADAVILVALVPLGVRGLRSRLARGHVPLVEQPPAAVGALSPSR